MRLGLALGLLGFVSVLSAAEPEFDYNLTQSPPRPQPDWVRMVDLGEQNPQLKGYFAPAGIKVEIIATEPTIVNPVGMRFSEDGTLYVLEWTPAPAARQESYDVTLKDGTKLTIRRMAKDTRDLLKTLHDADGDGVYDSARTVMDDLEIPSSLIFHEDWIYMASIGHVIRRRPSQPGGKYDVQEEILRGFCGFHHHQISGMTIGHDGWMYATSGDDDNRGEGTDGTRVDVLRTGAIIRSTPDGQHLSEFARGFRNPYRDVVFDENFNMFHVDNDQEDGSKFMGVRIMHVVEGADYGWRLFPGVVCCRTDFQRSAVSGEFPGKLPSMIKTGRGSPAGLLHYTGNCFPSFFKGAYLYPDVYRKLVRGYFVEPKGATFRIHQEFTLLQSEDDFFRPCHSVMGPDGAIYILDWRTDSGGAGRLWGDGKHGRLYRLSWSGTDQAPAIPLEPMDSWAKIAKLSDSALVGVLRTGDFERRQRAQRELTRRGESSRALFLKLLLNPGEPAFARIHALGGVQNFWDEDVEQALLTMLADDNPNLRRLAADGLGNHLEIELKKVKEPAQLIKGQMRWLRVRAALGSALAKDKDLGVKRQVALALSKLTLSDGAAPLLVTELERDDSDDVYYHDGLLRAVENFGAKSLRMVAEWMISEDADRRERGVKAFEAFRTRAAANLLAEYLPKTDKLTTEQRMRLFTSYRNYQFEPPITAEPVADWLEKNPNAPVEETLVALGAISLVGGVEPERLNGMLLKLIDSPNADVRTAVLGNIASLGIVAAALPLASKLKSDDRTLPEKKEILKTLAALRAREAIDALKELCQKENPLRADALQTLSVIRIQEAMPVAQATLDSQDPVYLATAINILGGSPDGAKLAGEKFQAGALPKSLLPVVSEALRKHAEKNAELAGLLANVMKGGLLVSLDPAEVKRVEDLVKTTGNARKGLHVFLDQSKVRCISCHKLEGVGGQTGPDLSKVWDTHSIAKIIESMIEPSKEVKEGYQTWIVETKEGLVHTGLKVMDDKTQVVLRDAQGKDIRVAKDDVEFMKADPKSLMPDNVIALLQYQEFIDLVAFLKDRTSQEELRSLNFQWSVAGPYPEDLKAEFPPEKSTDPRQPVAGPNGKTYAWGPAPVAANGLLDFGLVYNNAEHISAYALTFVNSPADQEAELLVGSDDQVRVWLNGALVHEYAQPRGAMPDQDRVKVKLKKGTNRVLAKVVNGAVTHHLYLRFGEAKGLTFQREP